MTIEHPHASTERILSVIPNVAVQAGFMGFKSRVYSLIISNNRIVFALLDDGLMWQLGQQEREQAKAQGMGTMGQWSASFQAWDRLVQHYIQQGPDGILAENPENFAVDRADVSAVKLKSTGSGAAGSPRLDYLILKTTGKKYKALLAGGKDEARAALEVAGLLTSKR